MTTQHGLVDLSGRAKFRLSGGDRVRYLNGQVSNDVEKVSNTAAIEACVCNLKGKLDGVVFITESGGGDSLWMDAPGELRESLFARLGRYIIADDCELEDVSDEFSIWHLIPPESRSEAEAEAEGGRTADRFGVRGLDFWTAAGETPPVEAAILDESAIEEFRILHGVPRWGAELTPDVFPAEAGLDKRAVDFQKGCYLGQEVVSRIESVGRVNRVLRLLVCDDPTDRLEAGMEILSQGEEKPAGRMTSAVFSGELGRFAALGFLRRPFADLESKLVTGPADDMMAIGLEVRKFKDGGF